MTFKEGRGKDLSGMRRTSLISYRNVKCFTGSTHVQREMRVYHFFDGGLPASQIHCAFL
jgi:hypothetical protein